MAKDKTSFILYSDLITIVKKLVERDKVDSTNNAGELFLHILEYVNDKDPIPVNFIIDMAFEPIKLSLKRDLKKYESYVEKQRVNGRKGGRPKETQITQPFILKPKKADSVSVSVSDSDSVSVNVSETLNNNNNNLTSEVKIDNSEFTKQCKVISSWSESVAMTNKIKIDVVNLFLDSFDAHLINYGEQKRNIKDFKSHFNNWLIKQDLSQFKTKHVGKSNQINYGN